MLFVFAMINVSAASSGSCGANLTWTLDDGGTLTISGSGAMNNYSSPSDQPWYSSRTNIKKVIIGDNITSIGEVAFYNCDSLTSITIPNSVTAIGSYAFSGCRYLTSIDIPLGVTVIEDSLFRDCSSLANISFHNGITTIKSCVFENCYNLTEITVPKSVTSLSNDTFSRSGLEKISVDAGNTTYTSIAGILYSKDKKRLVCSPCKIATESLSVPYGVECVGSSAFSGSTAKTIILPTTVKIIEAGAFSDCDSLTGITIPNSVTTIGGSAFSYCNSLTSITIPDSVSTIGYSAFYGCTSLETLVIGENVKSIGSSAFSECHSISKIIWNAKSVEDFSETSSRFFNSCFNATVIFGDKVESIPAYLFYYTNRYWDTDVSTIKLGSNVKKIGIGAFYGYYSKTLYFNGTKEEWKELSCTINGTVKLFHYVTLKTSDDKQISTIEQTSGDILDTSSIPQIKNCSIKLYRDINYTDEFKSDTPVKENMTLYVKYQLSILNNIEIKESTTADLGTTEIPQTISFATDKEDVVALAVGLKIPDYITIDRIITKDFELAEYEISAEGKYNYITIIGQYTENGDTIPSNEIITPFEILLDISSTATVGDATVEFTKNTYLVGNETYSFEEMAGSTIKISPQLAESIEIIGADSISTPTQYKVAFTPDYTTNQTITWSIDDEAIAIVSQDGILTPVKNGTVVLTATANDGSGVFVSKEISVIAYAKLTSLISSVGEWNKGFDADIKEYIIYVDSCMDEIEFTAIFPNGTLKINNSLAVKNVPKTIKLTDSITEITLALSGGTSLESSIYSVTVIKGNNALSSNVTKTEVGYSFSIFFNKNKIESFESATLIVALYDESRKFVGLNTVPVTPTDSLIPITVDTTQTATVAKLMLWDSCSTLRPLCNGTENTIKGTSKN